MTAIGMKYGDYNLQASDVQTATTDIYSNPERNIQIEDLALSDGGVYVAAPLKRKTFQVEGTLRATSIPACDMLIDQLKAGLRLAQQNFDMDYAGGTRRYVATARNLIISRPRGLTRAGWSVEFECASPVGWDIIKTTLLTNYPITLQSMSVPLLIGGSYKADPVLQLTYSSITGGTAKTVKIANDATLRGLSITRNWVAGDVLAIDSLKKTVYVNSRPQDFTGQFPTWDIGAAGLSYVDDFTARTGALSGDYTRRWL